MADDSIHGELRLPLDDELEAVLEQIRAQQNLRNVEEAAEWLLRRRLRKGTQELTGRGRALYPAGRK